RPHSLSGRVPLTCGAASMLAQIGTIGGVTSDHRSGGNCPGSGCTRVLRVGLVVRPGSRDLAELLIHLAAEAVAEFRMPTGHIGHRKLERQPHAVDDAGGPGCLRPLSCLS